VRVLEELKRKSKHVKVGWVIEICLNPRPKKGGLGYCKAKDTRRLSVNVEAFEKECQLLKGKLSLSYWMLYLYHSEQQCEVYNRHAICSCQIIEQMVAWQMITWNKFQCG
jgi:hypothetical protein